MDVVAAYAVQIETSEGPVRYSNRTTVHISAYGDVEQNLEKALTEKEELTWGEGCVTVFITGISMKE